MNTIKQTALALTVFAATASAQAVTTEAAPRPEKNSFTLGVGIAAGADDIYGASLTLLPVNPGGWGIQVGFTQQRLSGRTQYTRTLYEQDTVSVSAAYRATSHLAFTFGIDLLNSESTMVTNRGGHKFSIGRGQGTKLGVIVPVNNTFSFGADFSTATEKAMLNGAFYF